MAKYRVGLIVNPIAGMGGSVGLKGTDGDRATRARQLGAAPMAGERAGRALRRIAESGIALDLLTCSGAMGADLAAAAGLSFKEIYEPQGGTTSAADTRAAASLMAERGVALILFSGGDGTATDILNAVGTGVPILGIPAGVKMHSAVFAVSPGTAGDIACNYLSAGSSARLLQDAEVMDRAESSDAPASPELLGYARVPRVPMLLGNAKAAGGAGSIAGACRRAADRARSSEIALLGPGSTMQAVKKELGFDGTLLGVDAVCRGCLQGLDLNEQDILALLVGKPALLLVSIVGGQGFLFGRGNQQLSPAVLRTVGRNNVLVVSSLEKILNLADRRLYVDTGDESLDTELAGFIPVLVGERRTVQVPIGFPEIVSA
jgi:predicted polyphosphate/ATP-dependent NAD kinase